MVVLCPNCGKAIAIPEDKYRVPGLKGRCGACQAVFVVREAAIAPAPTPAPPQPPRPPVEPPALAAVVPSPAAPPPRSPSPLPQSAAPGSQPSVASAVTPTTRPASPAPVSPPAGASAPPRPRRSVPHWRRCVNHPQVASESVCPACRRGYCRDCGKTAGTATICPECDGLCRPTADHEAEERRALERARSLREELPIILRYPFVDVVAYVLLGLVVWAAMVARSVALFGGGVAVLFSQGLLLAYAFTAINRVSSGNLRSFTPDISDMTALVEPLRLSLAALLVSSAPLFLVVYLYPSAVPRVLHLAEGAVSMPVARAQDTEETSPASEVSPDSKEDGAAQSAETGKADPAATRVPAESTGFEPSAPVWVLPLMALAVLWKLVYSPIALAVAAISRSFLSTLNPVVGVGCIRSMGPVYWEAMVIYTVLVAIQAALGLAFGLIPVLGTLVRAFIDAYAYLAIGCTLGFAVFKKARELGVE